MVCDEVVEKNDSLNECIIDMFGDGEDGEELENTVISIYDDCTNITNEEEQNEDNGNEAEVRSTSSSVPEISLGNVFLLGRKETIELKIPLVRERKQNRSNRSRSFFLDMNETIIKMENDIESELDRITNVTLCNPWYRSAYRAISN